MRRKKYLSKIIAAFTAFAMSIGSIVAVINNKNAKRLDADSSVELVASSLGLGNAADWAGTTIDPITFGTAGTGTNPAKYYTTGTGLRLYNGDKFLISIASGYSITGGTFTFSGSGYTFSSSSITATGGTYSESGTTGTLSNVTASNVQIPVARTCRLQNVSITYSSNGGGSSSSSSSSSSSQSSSSGSSESQQHNYNYNPYTYTGNYYDTFDFDATSGMNGNLRISLTSLIRPAAFYTYSGSGVNYLSTQLQFADEDPTNSNNMVYFYTRNSVAKNAADTWNREHVWPQSLSNNNWGESEGGTDLLHLRPTYNSTNSSRGNTPYGDINKASPKYFDVDQLAVTNDSNKTLFGYCNGTYFEPLDSVKGDVARIIMYIWTTYTGWVGNKTYNSLNILSVMQSYDTLLRWHTLDQPDALEGHRNDYVQSSDQGNRNPFVDHPELAWKIFGDQASNNVKNACMAAYPANGGANPIEPTGVTLNRTSADLEVNDTLQLTANIQPNGATGSITWSSNNTNVATVSNTGLVTAVSEGNATITARVSENIVATCTVSVTDNSGVQPQSDTLFTADLTDTMSVTSGYTITTANTSKQTGYYQDKGTVGSSVCNFKVTKASPLFTSEPGTIIFTAHLGAGTTKATLDNNVEVCLVDSNGNDIESTRVTLTNSIIKEETEYTVNVPYSASAYGAKISHLKADSHNIRYYSFSLSISDERPGIDTYLDNASSIKTITGNEVISDNPVISNTSITFSSLGLENGVQYTYPFSFSDGSTTITFGGGGNDGKYYDTGTGIRTYSGGYFTIASSKEITQITFTWSGNSYKPNTNDIVNVGTYNKSTNTWTGSANSVTFTRPSASDHWRLQSVTVTTSGGSLSVNNVALRFGALIPVDSWTAINNEWPITDYGVILMKKTSLDGYPENTVEAAFRNSRSVTNIHKGSGALPQTNGVEYAFTARVNILTEDDYSTVYCAAPYIYAGDDYHFLTEMSYSVNTLANYCLTNGGSPLSNAALTILKGNL